MSDTEHILTVKNDMGFSEIAAVLELELSSDQISPEQLLSDPNLDKGLEESPELRKRYKAAVVNGVSYTTMSTDLLEAILTYRTATLVPEQENLVWTQAYIKYFSSDAESWNFIKLNV